MAIGCSGQIVKILLVIFNIVVSVSRSMFQVIAFRNGTMQYISRSCLGLHSIRSLVCTRRAKFMDSLLDTAPRALIAVYCAVLQCRRSL